MERMSVLCLLLCSLSGADSEIDVEAVLRDLTSKLAVLQTKMEQLQTLSEEQAAKLRELQYTEVDPMKEQLRGQAAELNGLKAWANVTEIQVDSLRRDRAVGQVAFSASLLVSGSGYTGPFDTNTPLVFRHVFSNIGNAYNPNTGFFTAPVRGAYHFELHIYGPSHSSHGTGAALVKNGQNIFMTWEHQTSGAGKTSNGATLLLEAGDVVFLRQHANTRIYDDENHHSMFSGHLLFPM